MREHIPFVFHSRQVNVADFSGKGQGASFFPPTRSTLLNPHPQNNVIYSMAPPDSSFACRGFHAAGITRRTMLKVGGMGLLGLTLPTLLQAAEQKKGPKARAKSVLFLYQFGGPSHIDMFDMKPDAPEAVRGSHKPKGTNADGIAISEHLPQLAKVMNKVTLIRSMHHRMNNHNPASYYALTDRKST